MTNGSSPHHEKKNKKAAKRGAADQNKKVKTASLAGQTLAAGLKGRGRTK